MQWNPYNINFVDNSIIILLCNNSKPRKTYRYIPGINIFTSNRIPTIMVHGTANLIRLEIFLGSVSCGWTKMKKMEGTHRMKQGKEVKVSEAMSG